MASHGHRRRTRGSRSIRHRRPRVRWVTVADGDGRVRAGQAGVAGGVILERINSTWTTHVVDVLRQPGSADAVAFGPSGFVIGWRYSSTGSTPTRAPGHRRTARRGRVRRWSASRDPSARPGLRSVVAFDGGYLASGYRLTQARAFGGPWTGHPGPRSTTVFGADGTSCGRLVQATDLCRGRPDGSGDGFIWTAPH